MGKSLQPTCLSSLSLFLSSSVSLHCCNDRTDEAFWMRSSSLAKRTIDTPEGSGVRGTLHTQRGGEGRGGDGVGIVVRT